MKFFHFAFSVVSLFLHVSCYNDKLEELQPLANYTNDCDSTLLDTYSSSVHLIMNQNCKSCHNGSTGSGGVDLSNYSSVVSEAQSSRLMGSIQGSGNLKMPPNTQLQSCETERLNRWIKDGMPQ